MEFKPKSIAVSFLISKIVNYLNYWVPAIFFCLTYISINSFFSDPKSYMLISVISATILAKMLTYLTLKSLKNYLTNDFKITVLRGFKKSSGFRNEILPTLGSYGNLLMISDTEFLTSSVIGDEEDATNIFSQYYKHNFSNSSSWRIEIEEFFKQSDLIIFYLSELPSKNIYWEMNKVIELGKIKSTLIIAEDGIKNRLNNNINFNKLKFSNIIYYSFNSNFKVKFKNFLKKT